MLTRSRTSLLLGCLLLWTMPSLSQETAEGIVRKAIQAAGYPTDNKPYHQTWRETGKMSMAGAEFPYDCQWVYEPAMKYRFDMKGEFGGQKMEIQFIQNGDKAKESAMGQSRMVEGEKLQETTHAGYTLWVCSLTPLVVDKGFTLKQAGDNEVGGNQVVSVMVKRQGKRDIMLHFDKKTGLLVGCSDWIKDEFQGWKQVLQEAVFSDYEKLPSGEMVFKSMVVKRDGKVLLQSKFSEQKRVAGSKPEAFKLD